MDARYAAQEIAHYVIHKCSIAGDSISNLQLQKILYFIQRGYANRKNTLLFADSFEAWRYGPVVPSVYYEFSSLGGRPISKVFFDVKIDNDTSTIIDPIIETSREKYPWDLVSETHENGSPWQQVYEIGKRVEIPNELFLTKN